MDFKTYITAVEKQLNQMTEAQKTDWIYAQARVVDENQREKFLNNLSGEKKQEFGLTPESILDWCGQIEKGKLYFETEEYEYYEEGAWDSDLRTEYHDIFGIIPYLEKAIDTCYQLLEQKEYDMTFRLLDRICRLEFYTDYDGAGMFDFEDDEEYEDGEEYEDDEEYGLFDECEGLTIGDLADEGLLSVNFRKMSLCLLYACYQKEAGKKRIEKLYEYLTWKQCSTIVLTDVFAYGPEKIEDEEPFMKEWAVFLMKTTGDRAAELLVDACIYLGGDAYLLETAGENVETHPYLYKAYCERKYRRKDYISCMEAAGTAMDQIDDNKVIRADIADIAIMSAKEAGEEERAYPFYQKAFYSRPNSWHLLRLYELEDKFAIEEALKRVRGIRVESSYRSEGLTEDQESSIYSRSIKMAFCFLLGDYGDIIKTCQEDNTYLGWSSDIKGIVVPLLLLLLKQDKEQKTRAEKELIDNVKNKILFKSAEGEEFNEYLSLWKKSVDLSEEKKEEYIKWLQKEIDNRTENVVGGGYRKSYYKAAELIVLLGAIYEERGEVNGMYHLIDHYKKQHSRKRAFKEEIDALAKMY